MGERPKAPDTSAQEECLRLQNPEDFVELSEAYISGVSDELPEDVRQDYINKNKVLASKLYVGLQKSYHKEVQKEAENKLLFNLKEKRRTIMDLSNPEMAKTDTNIILLNFKIFFIFLFLFIIKPTAHLYTFLNYNL